MGKRELVALLNLSSWCLVMVERLFLAVPWDCLLFVIVVFPDHTHLLFFIKSISSIKIHYLTFSNVTLRHDLKYHLSVSRHFCKPVSDSDSKQMSSAYLTFKFVESNLNGSRTSL